MTANPYVVAKSGSFEEFVLSQGNSNFGPSDLLYRSMANRSPLDRVRIANLLLDQGADVSFSEPFSWAVRHSGSLSWPHLTLVNRAIDFGEIR